jgi:hypothetical protein
LEPLPTGIPSVNLIHQPNETIMKNEWTYQHSIGVISVQGWGDPFLVVTESKFWDNQSWGYNYYKLGVSFSDESQAKIEADKLNSELNCKAKYFSSDESQNFLLALQQRFINAEIAKS